VSCSNWFLPLPFWGKRPTVIWTLFRAWTRPHGVVLFFYLIEDSLKPPFPEVLVIPRPRWFLQEASPQREATPPALTNVSSFGCRTQFLLPAVPHPSPSRSPFSSTVDAGRASSPFPPLTFDSFSWIYQLSLSENSQVSNRFHLFLFLAPSRTRSLEIDDTVNFYSKFL